MIQRRRDYAKREPSKDSHKIYVVCEGSGTEPNYFGFFRGLSSNLEVIPIPSEEGNTDPEKLMAMAKAHFFETAHKYSVDYSNGDTVWFVIDTDKWEEQGKIAPLREFCAGLNVSEFDKYSEVHRYEAWHVAQSNPCFEIWHYYHVFDEQPNTEDVEKAASFKDFVSSIIKGGFNYETHTVAIEDAIVNSEANLSYDENGKLSLYSTEVFRLGKEIVPFVAGELRKLKNKLCI